MHHASTVLNVEESDRLSFLPYLFDNDYLLAELFVYQMARNHLPAYEGGRWHFIRLPEGGGYMMPDCGPVRLVNPETGFDDTVGAEAAGIIITLLTINRRCRTHHDCDNAALTRLYLLRDAQLWHFAEAHPERAAIYAALN
ncbi:Antirestriction protein (plasmid) [Paramixta manurensis]|uniref:Antirestriction protein n=1 Tax=Paramixta manurensis TaxID=2740817 RepID=A0A6M8ULK8_9GAMM|nr:Antirestriction protein [Erwiniaceae bacterium PD-1]